MASARSSNPRSPKLGPSAFPHTSHPSRDGSDSTTALAYTDTPTTASASHAFAYASRLYLPSPTSIHSALIARRASSLTIPVSATLQNSSHSSKREGVKSLRFSFCDLM